LPRPTCVYLSPSTLILNSNVFPMSCSVLSKLEQAVLLGPTVDWDDPDQSSELADERAALVAELAPFFGPLIRQLVESSILTVGKSGLETASQV
jgi:hypothetical protein